MALELAERGEFFDLLFTRTGNELPGVREHLLRLADHCGVSLYEPPAPTLLALIEEFKALPNWRQRWCTRLIKIVPCIAWLKAHPGSTLAVGLRADEPERTGLYGAEAKYRYPLREWGWDRAKVEARNAREGMSPPKRTDCALCYGQSVREWYLLLLQHPAMYAEGERLEAETGFTFRSPGRDWRPVALKDLRAAFEGGFVPTQRAKYGSKSLKVHPELAEKMPCRVCRD
jgi:hypothetical protein